MITRESNTPEMQQVEAFMGCAELIGNKPEFDMICRLLNKPHEKITEERVLDEMMNAGLDWPSAQKLRKGFEHVGFPTEDEPMELEILSLKEMKGILAAGDTSHHVFNNEFTLFAYAPGKMLGDALTTLAPIYMSVQYNPVRQRLHSLAPGLFSALETYGSQHTHMPEFTGALAKMGQLRASMRRCMRLPTS